MSFPLPRVFSFLLGPCGGSSGSSSLWPQSSRRWSGRPLCEKVCLSSHFEPVRKGGLTPAGGGGLVAWWGLSDRDV